MKTRETIKVYVDLRNGKTVCICTRLHKGCDKPCQMDEVERDKYKSWRETMQQNRYGR